jgi:hypothetical protein
MEIPIDGRQSETALRIRRGTGRLLRSSGFAMVPEFTLATGRRADLIAVGGNGAIWIVEIKSSPEDFYSDGKWPEYRDYCDRLYFAVSMELDHAILPADAGLIVADEWGAEILRHPIETPLVGARRKALTLQIARTAALRLHMLHDPDILE